MLSKMVDRALEADQKHITYRPLPPGVLKPNQYQCTGCEVRFDTHDAYRRHRIVAIVNALLDFLAEHRDG